MRVVVDRQASHNDQDARKHEIEYDLGRGKECSKVVLQIQKRNGHGNKNERSLYL